MTDTLTPQPAPSAPPQPARTEPAGLPHDGRSARGAPRRRWPLRAGLVAAAVAGGWTLVAGHWLPGFLQPRIEQAASQALGTPVRLQALHVSPWTLTVTAQGLTIGPAASPHATLAGAEAQLSLQSLWQRAPVLTRLKLEQPRLYVTRLAADRYSFTPLLEHLSRRPAAPADAPPARFSLHNIRVTGGEIRLEDRVLGQRHLVSDVTLGVPFVSNLPADLDTDVLPELRLRIDGTAVQVKGRALPFKAGRRSQIELDSRDIDLARWAQALRPLLPPEQRIDVERGRLALQLRVSFEARPAPARPQLTVSGRLQADDLVARWPAQGLQAIGARITVDGLDLQPLARQVAVAGVTASGLAAEWGSPVRQRSAPTTPLTTPPAPAPAVAAPASPPAARAVAAPAAAAPPWAWRIDRLDLQASRLAWRPDAAADGPTLGPARLQAAGLSSRPDAPAARVSLDIRDAGGGRMSAQASVSAARRTAQGRITVADLRPAPWLDRLRAQRLAVLPWQLQRGAVAGDIRFDLQSDQLVLRDSRLELSELAAHPADGDGPPTRPAAAAARPSDGLQLATLRAEGLGLTLRLPFHAEGAGLADLHLARLAAQGLVLQLSRDAQGRWRGLPAGADDVGSAPAAGRPAGAGASQAPPGPAARTAGSPRLRIDRLSCQACAITVQDGTTQPTARLALRDIDLGAEGVTQEPSAPIRWTLAARDAAGGRLNASGSVRAGPLALQAQIKLDRLDLTPLQPFLEPRLNVTLTSGRAVADGRLELAELSGAPAEAARARGDAPYDLRWQGRVALAELRAVDELNDADLLRWKLLNLQDARARWLAGALDADLGRVALDQFYGRVIINASGRLNLADIVRHPETARASLTTPEGAAAADAAAVATAPASAASASAPAVQQPLRRGQAAVATLPPPQPATTGPRPQLRWSRIALRGGRVDFTDNFIKPNYSARLTRLDGDIAALSSQNPQPADVRITGRVDDGAPLEITGRVNPLGARLYTDLRGSAQGIELTRLTPYAARYAGYAIEKGTLSMKVQYHVENGQLRAQNQLYLDQLTFGEPVDSPQATKLPVRLAIALLKDRHGVIDVNLPVSGSLDDPQFSIGGIIWRVIANLITKAVTAPFALLSGSHEELGYIAFAPGSAELDDAARARLDQLADKLADRPALRLEATGHADPALDGPGLRERHVMQLMRRAKAASTGQRASEVTIEPAERERWLAAAYQAADIKKPRNLIGLAKSLSADDMEALLQADATVDDDALRLLANRRGDRVKAYLATKLPAERVLLTASQIGAPPQASQGSPQDQGPTTRVQFSVR